MNLPNLPKNANQSLLYRGKEKRKKTRCIYIYIYTGMKMSKARIVSKNKMEKKNPIVSPAPVHNRKMYFHRAHILFCPFQCTSQLLARACALSRVKCPHDLLFALSPFLFLSFSAHLCTATTVYVSWNRVSQTGKQTETRASSPNEVS